MQYSISTAAGAGVAGRNSSGWRMGASAMALTAAIGALAFGGVAHAEDGLAPAATVSDAPAGAPIAAAATIDDLNSAISAKPIQLAQNTAAAGPSTAATPTNPVAGVVPDNYTVDAVDKQIGTNPFERFVKYYFAEWGKDGAPVDPKAPPSIRDGWPAIPQSTPPMPFTDWPYGGTTLIGDNRTASVDSPLMVALAHTPIGDFSSKTGIQAYGWIDYGGNISSSTLKAGNAPAAYDYNPNNVQLDQAVLYVERTPDTVQTDHVDWGFRFSAIYGENYRYTTAYGVASYQLLKYNHFYGYDFPMVYGELWIPQVMQGLMIRVGRYISLPDIEAQLAPNNYMYTHSITYTLDNYTNQGIQTTLAVTKQIMLQVGVSVGTEAAVWHLGSNLPNPFVQQGLGPDPLYPGKTYKTDPGAQASWTVCGRWQSMDGNSDVNACADAINSGQWGYNNLQWYGLTAYHKFNKYFHVSWEFYNEHQDGVPNANNPTALNIWNNGGTPFSPQNLPFNQPYLAQCKSATVLRCRTDSYGTVAYWNFSPNARNNFSLRTEYYDDPEGQRTGFATSYYDVGIGWQHWLSPQVEFRPEFTSYWASKPSFNLGTKNYERVFSGDIIWHF
jgi:hypothetical protein